MPALKEKPKLNIFDIRVREVVGLALNGDPLTITLDACIIRTMYFDDADKVFNLFELGRTLRKTKGCTATDYNVKHQLKLLAKAGMVTSGHLSFDYSLAPEMRELLAQSTSKRKRA